MIKLIENERAQEYTRSLKMDSNEIVWAIFWMKIILV